MCLCIILDPFYRTLSSIRAAAQKKMLERVDRFAKDHKLEWGVEKCKVMRLNELEGITEWDQSDTKIQECESYTYLLLT